jgi:hypothetical protein
MGDPLSVAGSVVGLLTTAAQASKMLFNLTKRTRAAPQECLTLKLELDEFYSVLSQLQLFVFRTEKPSQSGAARIMVDQVLTTLTACVTTFSALKALVEQLQLDQVDGILDRLRWVSKEKDIRELLSRLQRHKSSLSAMLSMLTA